MFKLYIVAQMWLNTGTPVDLLNNDVANFQIDVQPMYVKKEDCERDALDLSKHLIEVVGYDATYFNCVEEDLD